MTSPAEFMSNGGGELTGEVVPFGKYRGRPVAELAADDGYRDWVLAQPWVRERYGNFYQILVQGAPPSQDSPEHNEMQARFLDEDWCLRLVTCLPALASHGLGNALDQVAAWQARNPPDLTQKYVIQPECAADVEFEKAGWDVFFNYRSAALIQHWSCECPIQYDGDQPPPWDDARPWDNRPPRWDNRDEWERDWGKPAEPSEPHVPKPVKPEPPGPDISSYYPPGQSQLYPPVQQRQYYERQRWASYQERLAAYPAQLAEYPAKLAEKQSEHQAKLAEYRKNLAEYARMRHFALDHGDHKNIFRQRISGHPRLGGEWIEIAAELKPDLGDDYPAVLRQVKGHLTERVTYGRGQYGDAATCDFAFTVARRAQFRSVTWEQVRRVFAASGIILIRESDISG